MPTRFHKMHGLGNDFVILDQRDGEESVIDAALAKAICDRRTGIGCDQLIRLSSAKDADLRMDIWNADGGRAEACGNASRCVVALTGARTIATEGGKLAGSGSGEAVSVLLGEPAFAWDAIPLAEAMDTAPLPCGWDALERPDAVNVGNPHLCFFVSSLDDIPLESLGPSIENDPLFPERINVNVAKVEEDGSLTLRTFERGAGLTLACGTGACATAVAAIRRKLVSSPVTVHMRGGDLSIAWAPGQPIRMTGPATHVFSGEIDLKSLA